jgi:ABC-type Fe3+ transport system permease subunit
MGRTSAGREPATSAPRPLLSWTAMAVAVVAALFAFIPLAFVLSVPLGVLAVGLGGWARRRARSPLHPGTGRDTAGVAIIVATFAVVLGLLSALAAWNATRLPDVSEPSPEVSTP